MRKRSKAPAKARPTPSSASEGTQEKLRVSEEQFRFLVETVEEYAIYLLDPQGKVATWNLGAEKLKGYTAEEIVGKNFACFYTDEDVAARKPQHNLEMAAKRGHIRDQGVRVRKDGSTFHADVVLTALRDKAGKLRGFSKVTRDVTDQIRTREIEAAKIAAEKASKAKDDFLAALSHELRTPLTPTLAAASYLSINASRISPEFTTEIDTIQRNVQLQARLIDDLLDLTRAVRGKLELHFDRADAHGLVRDALEIARADIISKKLDVTTKYAAKKHHIWADPVRVQQVFWNLINNAVKFTAPGGKIDIVTRNTVRDQFEFEISDNGIGIDPAKLETLFQPFEQGGAEVTRQFGGLGLGLAISKHLMDLHDGTIVQIHQVFGNGQTKSEPTKLPRHFGSALLERLEQCFEFGRIDADAVVADLELELIAHCVPRHDVDLAAGRSEFHRIVDQVPEHLLNAHRIGPDVMFFGGIFCRYVELL